MTITASEVNKLRKQIGAGMMDCKKALEEAKGDFEKAIDILRKKGRKIAAKRADQKTGEGYVLSASNSNTTFGVIVSLNCETDFVAKNDRFVELAQSTLNMALEHKPADKESLLKLDLKGTTLENKLIEQTGIIGEKLEIGAYETLEAPFVATYIHTGNKLATLVGMSEKIKEVGKHVAMQAAAMNPIALTREEVPWKTIDRELEVGRDLARREGKPEEMLDKIARGRLNKFYKENILLEQEYIRDSKMNIAKYLGSVKKGLTLTGFRRVSLRM